MNEQMIKQFMGLRKELGKTYPTMRRYVDSNACPADVCLRVAEITNGDIRTVDIRPDLFKPNHAQINLANDVLDEYEYILINHDPTLLAIVLNYLENQCPDLYGNMVEEINKTDLGKSFIKQRNSHRPT